MEAEKIDLAIEYLESEQEKWEEILSTFKVNSQFDVMQKVIVASECRKINRDIEVLKLLR